MDLDKALLLATLAAFAGFELLGTFPPVEAVEPLSSRIFGSTFGSDEKGFADLIVADTVLAAPVTPLTTFERILAGAEPLGTVAPPSSCFKSML